MSLFETQGLVPGVDPELLAAQIQRDLTEALSQPLGEERLQLLEELANLAAKHGLEDMEVSIRLEIVWDALDAGDTCYALTTCSWVLDRISHDGFAPSEEQLLIIATQMLQIPTLAARHPGVDAKIIENLMFWTDFFTAQAKIPLQSRQTTRHQVELGLGHRLAARDTLEIVAALEDVPREVRDEADCPLHHFRSRIAWAVNTSDYAGAITLYRDALERNHAADWQCLRPDDINPLMMLPLAWAGEGDAAWIAHELSYRHQCESSQYLGDIAAHLRYCAATWNISEGLEVLRTHAHWFTNPEDPWDLLVATRAGAMFLSRVVEAFVNADYPVSNLGFSINGENRWLPFKSASSDESLDIVATRLRAVARRLALAFDLRNSNNTVSTRSADALQEPPFCEFSDVEALLTARLGAKKILELAGLEETSAAWVLPPIQNKNSDYFPDPDYSLLDEKRFADLEHNLESVLASLDFSALPQAVSPRKERLVLATNRVALLSAGGKWREVIAQAGPLIELGASLEDHRQSLRLASLLVQAHWQLSELSEARDWLIRADTFVDATIPLQPRALLEDLAILAG